MQAIITKYLGPTNNRGSRIVAKCERGRIIVSWDYKLNVNENHKAARDALLRRFIREDVEKYGPTSKSGWDGKWIMGGTHKFNVHVHASEAIA